MKVSSATEVLRRMLDEHGIECTYGYGIVSYKSDSHWCNAWECGDGMMCVSMGYFTPEQAIATTLGRGTLTAEQVRGAIMSADRWEKPMGNTGLTNTHLIIRDDGWQAIADELNATLGSCNCTNSERTRTCCNEWQRFGQFKCSACGYTCLGISDGRVSFSEPRHCPNCGAEVCDGE